MVFAGLTVMIALIGLSVARIPFLTTMGIAAALAVAIAVLIALTLLPALLGFGGEKLRPRAHGARTLSLSKGQSGKAQRPFDQLRERTLRPFDKLGEPRCRADGYASSPSGRC